MSLPGLFQEVFLFYSMYFLVFPSYLQSRKLFIVYLLAVAIIYGLIAYFYDYFILTYQDFSPPISLLDTLIVASISFIFFSLASLCLFAGKFNQEKIRINSEKSLQLSMEREKLMKRTLDFYKSNFFSHITFNTLSHIYEKVMEDEEIATPIQYLSEILRYNHALDASRKINLDDEINYIRKFIDLHKIISPNLYVNIAVKGDASQFFIIPMILINYVENALKYGVRNDPDFPISISFMIDKEMCFTVKNRKRKFYNGISTGTGMKNTYQALETYYQNRFKLIVQDEQEFYEVQLHIMQDRAPALEIKNREAIHT